MEKRRLFIAGQVLIIVPFFIFIAFASGAFCGDEGIVAEPYLYEGDMRMFKGELEGARKIYDFILKEDPRSYEALWRLSRFYISRGMAAEKVKDKKKEWKRAEAYGRQAVEINSDAVEGHLYLAIAMGKLALFSPPADKVKSVWEIKREAEKAIELDPAEEKAYLTLGSWHREVATASSFEKSLARTFFGKLPEGSVEESLRLLLKSIDLGGNGVRNHYELALTYEAMEQYEAAKAEYKKALSADCVYVEDEGLKKRIEKILHKSRYN